MVERKNTLRRHEEESKVVLGDTRSYTIKFERKSAFMITTTLLTASMSDYPLLRMRLGNKHKSSSSYLIKCKKND